MNLENLTQNITQGKDKWMSWNYIRDHVFLCVGKKGAVRNAATRDYLNVSLYMKVCVDEISDGQLSFKVTDDLIRQSGIPEEVFWKTAEENRRCICSVRPMSEILGVPDVNDEMLYVASSGDVPGGAGALALTDLFRLFCQLHEEQSVFVLPSSSEELLLLPESKVSNCTTAKELAEMVQTINGTVVEECIQLDPVVYRYQMAQNELTIAERA